MTTPDSTDRLREALDETQRMLEYLWSATGDRAPDMPVSDLFNDDDPLIQDIPAVLGRARIALHSTAAPAPDLLAAVEALRQTGIPEGDRNEFTRGFDAALEQVRALIESRSLSTSREAGLDAERLAAALNNTVGTVGWMHFTRSAPADEWLSNAKAIAAEYARLAASPSPDESAE